MKRLDLADMAGLADITAIPGPLAARDITLRYGRRLILNNVSLSLPDAACTLLTGANGAGKTSLMKILAGLQRPETGRMRIDGKWLNWVNTRRALMKQVMYLHQKPYLFLGDTRRNLNLAMPGHLSRAERRKRLNQALIWAGLTAQAEQSARTLSGGEAQRLAIARAWLRQAPIVLLDEPLTSIDGEARDRVLKLLLQLRLRGTTLLVCSHTPRLFANIAEQRLHLANGKIRVLTGADARR